METEKKPNPGPEQGLDKETVLERGKIEKIGGPIELEKVINWKHNYSMINDKYTTSHLFGRKVIEKLLAQKDCQGIRMHYCIDDMGKKQLVLSGVDQFGNNQLPRGKQATKTENKTQLLPAIAGNDDYELVDQSWPCPGTQGCSSI